MLGIEMKWGIHANLATQPGAASKVATQAWKKETIATAILREVIYAFLSVLKYYFQSIGTFLIV